MKFSSRTQWPAGVNRLAVLADDFRQKKRPFIDLTRSNPTACGFKTLSGPLRASFPASADFFYEPDPRGQLSARGAICRYYAAKKENVSPDQIILTSGTSEAYSFLFRLLLNPGESLAVPAPSYPLLDSIAGLNDIEMLRYRLLYERDRWRTDRENLKKCGPVKAVCVVNPNNPTGHFVSRSDKVFLNHFCAERAAALISDEVFLDFSIHNKTKPFSFAGNQEVLTFTLSGISKMLGLPQMKLSWIVVSGPKEEADEALRRLEIIADTYLSVNSPVQTALESWLGRRLKINREIIQRIAANGAFLKKLFTGKKSLKVLNAEGGWQAVIRTELGLGDEELALKLLRHAGVLAHPGYLYDFDNGEYLVVSLLLRTEEFKEGVARIGSFLDKLPSAELR